MTLLNFLDLEEQVPDELELSCVQYSNVTFIKDFGPWKVGYVTACIAIDFEKGIIIEYDSKNSVLKVEVLRLEII